MPSNKQITKEILAINPEAKVSGLNNAQLAEMLKALKAVKADAAKEHEAGEVGAALMEDEAPAPAPAKRLPFSVAAGKAITTKRGILSDGAEVKAEDFPGGAEALEALIPKYVVRG